MKGSIKIISDSKWHRESATTISEDSKKESAIDDNFDPYEYGREDGVESWAAAVLIIRSCVGSTFVLIPFIIKNLGYVNGTLILIATGIVNFHTIHSLVSTEYKLCKQLNVERLSFVELSDKVFERSPFPFNKLRTAVRYSMYSFYSLPTSCVGYLILTANELQTVAAYFDIRLTLGHILSAQIIPITLLCLSPNILRTFLPLSSVTNVGILAMALVVAAYSMAHRTAPIRYRAFGDASLIPASVATLAKAFNCTGLILPLKKEMKRPRKLGSAAGSLNMAAAAITAFYFGFGAILYASYGDGVRENVLDNLPADSYLTRGILFFYTTSMYSLYALSFYGRFENVWSGTLKQKFSGKKYESAAEYAVRIGINTLAYLMAVAVPNFAVISAISGTISFVLEMALPCVLEMLVELSNVKKNYLLMVKDAAVVSLCFGLFFMSAAACVRQTMQLHSQHTEV